jgi:hypothetical protein
MIGIDVNVTASPNKLTNLHVHLLRNHVKQCGLLAYVKGQTEEKVTGTLKYHKIQSRAGTYS